MIRIPSMASSEEEEAFLLNDPQQLIFSEEEFIRHGGFLLVFDIRQKSSAVPPSTLRCFDHGIQAFGSLETVMIHLSAQYNVSKTRVSFYQKECMAVIKNDAAAFHVFFRNEMKRRQETRCIAIDSEKTVAFLKTKLSLGLKSDIALFRCSNGIQYLTEEEKIGSVLDCGDTIRCIENAPKDIKFHHLTTEYCEHTFTLSTRPATRIRDIKQMLENKCKVRTGQDTIWLTRGTRLLKDDDFLFSHFFGHGPQLSGHGSHLSGHGSHLSGHGSQRSALITLHIKPAQSFPVKVKMENESFLILMSLPVKAVQLRKEISKHVKKAPEMLKLFVKDRKLREEVLTAEEGLVKGCTITVSLARKIPIYIRLPNNSDNKQELRVYKLDPISDVKNNFCESLGIPTHHIELFFGDVRMEYDKTLSDYRVHSGDILQLLVLKEPISLQVHIPSAHGWNKWRLTVDKHRQCTVRDLKEYLSREYKICTPHLVFEERCLEEDFSLSECKLRNGSSIVVQRSSTDGCCSRSAKVQIVYSVDLDGTTSALPACEVEGVMFYATESMGCKILKTTSLQSQHETEKYKTQHIFTVGSTSSQDRRVSDERNNDQQTSELRAAVDELTQVSVQKRDPCLSKSSYLHGRNFQTVNDEYQETGSLSEVHLNSAGNGDVLKMFSQTLMKMGDSYKLQTASFVKKNVPAERADDVFKKDMASFSDAMSSETDELSGRELLPKSPSQFRFPTNVVSDADLQNVASRIGSDWQKVAVMLGLEHHTVEMIVHQSPLDVTHQAMKAFTQWRKMCSRNATLEKLKEVLRECELNIIADSFDNTEDAKTSPT